MFIEQVFDNCTKFPGKLQKAGLGFKKLQLYLGDDEVTVFSKIKDTFPKLNDCSVIEILLCPVNSKDLIVINCYSSARSIKENLGGGQGRVYIRPIQKSLSTTPTQAEDKNSSIKEECNLCKGQFLLGELRRHVETCGQEQDTDTSASGSDEADGVSDDDDAAAEANDVAVTSDGTANNETEEGDGGT